MATEPKRPSENRFDRPYEWLLSHIEDHYRAPSDDRYDQGGRLSQTIPQAEVRRLETLRDLWLEAVDNYRSAAMNIQDPVDLIRVYGPAATAEMRFIAAAEALHQKYSKQLGVLDWRRYED